MSEVSWFINWTAPDPRGVPRSRLRSESRYVIRAATGVPLWGRERWLCREQPYGEYRMKRRSFFSWGTAGLVALCSAISVSLGAVVRFLTPSVFYEPPQTFKIGNPADFSFGPPTFLAEEKIFVFRDREKGFAVANAVCTHLGCTVGYFQSDERFHCPCHGSVFTADGTVQHGPAPRPLEWFEVTLARDGKLRVDKDRVVPASYRLMVS